MSGVVLSTSPAGTVPQRDDDLAACVQALLEVLSLVHSRLKRLAELARDKLSALRRADTAGLQRCADDEAVVLEALFAAERERAAVLARLAQHVPGAGGRGARLSELAGQLAEPFSSQIRAKIEGLREASTRLQRGNRIAGEVARNLHAHLRAMLTDVARANRQTVGYRPDGRGEEQISRTWIDALG